jgi:hypothetical protein
MLLKNDGKIKPLVYLPFNVRHQNNNFMTIIKHLSPDQVLSQDHKYQSYNNHGIFTPGNHLHNNQTHDLKESPTP